MKLLFSRHKTKVFQAENFSKDGIVDFFQPCLFNLLIRSKYAPASSKSE